MAVTLADPTAQVEAVQEHVRRRPAAPLLPYVAGYSGYRLAGQPPGTHSGLPSPYLTVILAFDDPLEIAGHPDPAQPAGRYEALLGGLHTRPATIVHPGRQSGVQLAMTPLGARALLGLPAGELAFLDVHGEDVLGPWAGLLRERLLAAPGWPAVFRELDAALLARVDAAAAMPADLAAAWGVLLDSRGAVPVADLAADLGWSARHFGERFRTEVGLSPKAAARVVRFDRARRLLARQVAAGGPPRLSTLAVACGYYDQAHLARDFRDLAGRPPTRWLTEELRNVQASAGDPEPDSLP